MTLFLLSIAFGAEPTPATASERPAVHQRMVDHYLGTTRARAAVLRGDVDGAKAEGATLAKLGTDGLPATWVPHLSELTQASRELANAPDLEQAGEAFERVAIVCADCHAALDGGPKLGVDPGTPPEWTEASHMPRHLWGSELIWMGILANDDAAVLRGAKAIADGPVVQPGDTRDPAIVEWEAAIHATAKRMADAPDLASRRQHYGELITGCGSCHRALEAEGRTP